MARDPRDRDEVLGRRPVPGAVRNLGKPGRSLQAAGAGAALPGRAFAPEGNIPTVSIPPPWQFPIPGAVDFYLIEKSEVLAAVVGASVTPDALRLAVGSGFKAVVRFVTIFVNAPDTTTDVDWSLLVNNGPVRGWSNLTTFPRVANNISIDFDGVVRISQASIVQVRIRNNAATGPWTVGAAYGGWVWPIASERRIYGSVEQE